MGVQMKRGAGGAISRQCTNGTPMLPWARRTNPHARVRPARSLRHERFTCSARGPGETPTVCGASFGLESACEAWARCLGSGGARARGSARGAPARELKGAVRRLGGGPSIQGCPAYLPGPIPRAPGMLEIVPCAILLRGEMRARAVEVRAAIPSGSRAVGSPGARRRVRGGPGRGGDPRGRQRAAACSPSAEVSDGRRPPSSGSRQLGSGTASSSCRGRDAWTEDAARSPRQERRPSGVPPSSASSGSVLRPAQAWAAWTPTGYGGPVVGHAPSG